MNRIKGLSAVFLLLLLTINGVSAINVDCKSGRWDTDICRDWELQDEFNEVTTQINSAQDDIKDLEKKAKKNKKTDGKQWDAIEENQAEIAGVSDNVAVNTLRWNTDSGISMRTLRRFAFGELLDYFKGFFASKSLEEKVYLQEAKIYFLEQKQPYNEIALITKAASLKMAEENQDNVKISGYTCSVINQRVTCVR
jgi:hypothetical protein